MLTDLLIEIEITIIKEMNEVLDGPNRRVLATSQALVRFALLPASNEALDLDDLLHVLFVVLLLFSKPVPDELSSRQGLEVNDCFLFGLYLH